MPRAQAIVHRGGRLLMVKHRYEDGEWWALPGGAISVGETPIHAVLRELAEECGVQGTVVRETSVTTYTPDDQHFSFLVDIGDQEPALGRDPELGCDRQILADLKWLSLDEILERDRAFVWTAGHISLRPFLDLVKSWGDRISYPSDRASSQGVCSWRSAQMRS